MADEQHKYHLRAIVKTIFLALLLFACFAVCAGDVEDAKVAFNKQDYETALQKFKSAGTEGNTYAQSMVGVMYGSGLGVAQDHIEAMRWFKLAESQGHTAAQFNLGMMYEDGRGVEQDYVRARMWYDLAAMSDDQLFKKSRDKITKMMSTQQIEQAQKMARECQARNFKNCD